MKTTRFIKSSWCWPLEMLDSIPCMGAKPVMWLVDGKWTHKGWLMPELQKDGSLQRYVN